MAIANEWWIALEIITTGFMWVDSNHAVMVSDIEIEIALTVIQLTGVILPILAGVTGYYLIHDEKIDKIIYSHDETTGNASIVDILESLYLALLISYFSALAVMQGVNLFLLFSLASYGTFLFFAIMGLLIIIDASLVSFAKVLVKFFLYIVVIGIAVILISWNAGYALLVSFLAILLLFWSAHDAGLTEREFFSRSNTESDTDDGSEECEDCDQVRTAIKMSLSNPSLFREQDRE